ncbi:Zinc carboxypeptidase [Bacteroidales bacterium Barb4]|nr:Zinc carboxypeptidase [Bacteroidales bacterium Barb4]
MKKNIAALFILLATFAQASAQDKYYFEGQGKLNPDIPTPEAFFGFPIGTSLVRYDKVVEYFHLLADKSDRATLEVFGISYEDREQIALIISSPANLKNLESIRREHLTLVDPNASLDISKQKVILQLSYNVHGGEIAGTDAAVVTAYYLIASEEPDIVNRLDEAVVLVEPSQNPDGRERATNYMNSFHSWPPVSDPADREHAAGITPHRGNHFWNDLNRDWLPLSQVESRNRVAYYHKWYPNVYLDYHEMGSESSYYFEPSPPHTWSTHTVPESNYTVLNGILANYFSKALNSIGSLYFTKESFTNLSPVYGSTYPDYQGGVGTTLEVGSTAGVLIETEAGLRPFSRNIKDNFLTGIASLRASTDEKAVFLNYQKDFFKSALATADKLADKYIVFGSKADKSLTDAFLNLLLIHNIEVYELPATFSQGDKKFEVGSAYVIPYRQPQYRILNSIFEERTQFDDPTFYDTSAWSIIHGFGLPFAKVKAAVREGARVTQVPATKGSVSSRSDYAYVFEYLDYLAPKALYYLQDKGVKARVAQSPFKSKTDEGEKSFLPGTIVVPVHYQTVSPDELYKLVTEAAALANIRINSVVDGFSLSGIDLGSNNIRVLKKPSIAALTGGGANWTNIGELWLLLGNTHNIPLSKIDVQSAARIDLSRYTSLILSGSGSTFTPEFVARLTAWVEAGGTLIATGQAAQWAVTSKLATGFRPDSTASSHSDRSEEPYAASARTTTGRLTGAILPAGLNLSSPLAYGFTSRDFYTIKSSTFELPRPFSPDGVILETTSGEPVNGYVAPTLQAKLKNNPVVVVSNRGRGSIVLFGESPTFRSYWLAPGRILTNAVFFGNLLASPGRY